MKKALSLILAFVLLFSLLPFSAAAEEPAEDPAEEIVETVPEEDPGEEPADSPADEPGEEPSEEPAEPADPSDPGEEPPEDPAEPVEEPAAPADPSEPGEDPAEDPAEELEEEEPEEEEEEPSELPFGFPGLPEGYEFSVQELTRKQKLLDNDVPATVSALVPGTDYVEDEVLFLADSEEYAQMVAEAYGAELLRYNGHFGVLRLVLASVPDTVAASVDMELALPAVEPNYIICLDPMESVGPNLPEGVSAEGSVPIPTDWESWVRDLGLDDTYVQDPSDSDYQWQHDMINTYEAWGVTTGSPSVVVAVIDSGITAGHPDFANTNILDTGYDFIGYDEDPTDGYFHGTYVSGILAASMQNGRGGVGVAPNVSILPIRVFDSKGENGTIDRISDAIYYAANHGAWIINMSLGGSEYSSVQEEAINYAYERNCTVIASMGNDHSNIRMYPAFYDHVISVASVDRSGRKAAHSNYGAWCDIAAPGEGITSMHLSGYTNANGTSAAAPMVSGAAALYMSVYGWVSPDKMEKVLKAATNESNEPTYKIGKILDVSKLFPGNKKAPQLYVSGENQFKTVKNGSTSTIGGYADSWIEVTSGDASRRSIENAGQSSVFVYTDNGTKPTVLNGAVKNGKIAARGEGDDCAWVSLMDYTVGKTYTFKFIEVDGRGVSSSVASVKIKIKPSVSEEIRENVWFESFSIPSQVSPGKSVVLTASLVSYYTDEDGNRQPTYSFDRSVNWTIHWQSEGLGAKLDAKTGKLTIPAGVTEFSYITIVAASNLNPNVSMMSEIEVAPSLPAGKVTLTPNTNSYLYVGNTLPLRATLWYSDGTEMDVETASLKTLRWTSSDPKVASVDADGVITALQKGKATITCTVLDGSGKKASIQVLIAVPLTVFSVAGQAAIAPGTSAIYRAWTNSDANNKKVDWSIGTDYTNGAVSVNTKGKVTVPSDDALIGSSFELVATPRDGQGGSNSTWVSIYPKVTSVAIVPYSEGQYAPVLPTYDKKGNVNGGVIYSLNLGDDTKDESTDYPDVVLRLADGTEAPNWTWLVKWSSSDPSVATVNSSGKIQGLRAGKTVITATADDGSGKSAKYNIRVINPVSSIRIYSKAGENSQYLAYGKSLSLGAALGDAYGKPGITGVTWDFRAYDADDNNWTDYMKDTKGITISSKGVLKTTAKAKEVGIDDILVIATTTDGTELRRVRDIYLADAATFVKISEENVTPGDAKTVKKVSLKRSESKAYYLLEDSPNEIPLEVRSSNSKIVGAYAKWDDTLKVYKLYIQPSASNTGKATITVYACDGSGVKATIEVTVKKK